MLCFLICLYLYVIIMEIWQVRFISSLYIYIYGYGEMECQVYLISIHLYIYIGYGDLEY